METSKNVDIDKRKFIVDSCRIPVAILLGLGFVPVYSEANVPLVFARVATGALSKKINVSKIGKFFKNVTSGSRVVSVFNKVSDRDIEVSENVQHLESSDPEEINTVNQDIKEVEEGIPDAVWSQNGDESFNNDSNKVSVIIVNNSGKEIKPKVGIDASVVAVSEKKEEKEEAIFHVRPETIKPGITIVESQVSKIPKRGVKKIKIKKKEDSIKIENEDTLSGNKVVVATAEEIKSVKENKGSGSILFEKYMSSINISPQREPRIEQAPTPYRASDCFEENGSGTGTKLYNIHVGDCKNV